MDEPLWPDSAKRLIRRIIATGQYAVTPHASQEMQADGLTTLDCVNVLRGGAVRPAEYVRGTWRYRVETQRITVVIAFRSERELAIITAWRAKESR